MSKSKCHMNAINPNVKMIIARKRIQRTGEKILMPEF
jgi:hypothetical protein